jgi:hypothetical protein
MPHHQRTSVAAKRLVNMRQALQLRAEGMLIGQIAERLSVNPATAKRYIAHALATESMFPSSLDAAQVSELRQIEAEALVTFRQAAQEVLQKVQARVGTDEEKGMDATAAARLVESAARVSERLAKMFGLDAPSKAIEEQYRLQVNLTKVDNRVVVQFDRDQLKPKWPTPYGARGGPICTGMIADASTDDGPAAEES